MKVTVVGSGYVGLVVAACQAELGHRVHGVDVDAERVARLQAGRVPFHEPGLDDLVSRHLSTGRLVFTGSLDEAVAGTDVFVVAVGTPEGPDGAADLQHVRSAVKAIGEAVDHEALVVIKSTVPVGTASRLQAQLDAQRRARGARARCRVASNPEFLREGSAVRDFLMPDRIVLGVGDDRAREILLRLYAPLLKARRRLLVLRPAEAELTKYAANALLASRISFMNEIAALCERLGVDVRCVREGIGSDRRIGPACLAAGCGYGGSCFPKDVQALVRMGEDAGVDMGILRAVHARNLLQKGWLFDRIRQRFGADLRGFSVGLWGLAFKPGTDDLREAPSLDFIDSLLRAGARVQAFDPVAAPMARQVMPAGWFRDGRLMLCDSASEACEGVDALALVTEWNDFRDPDPQQLRRRMRQPVVLDGRNLFDPARLREAGFEYHGVGRA